jgi:hypothetical protein
MDVAGGSEPPPSEARRNRGHRRLKRHNVVIHGIKRGTGRARNHGERNRRSLGEIADIIQDRIDLDSLPG